MGKRGNDKKLFRYFDLLKWTSIPKSYTNSIIEENNTSTSTYLSFRDSHSGRAGSIDLYSTIHSIAELYWSIFKIL